MSIKEKINQVKDLIKSLEIKFSSDHESEIELSESVLTNGTIARYEKLEVGQKFMLITEAGETAAEDGTYELEDGTLVSVSAGLISEIVPKSEAPKVDTPEVAMATQDALDNFKKEYEEKLSGLETKFSSQIKEILELSKSVSEVVALSSSEPASSSIVAPRNAVDRIAEAKKIFNNQTN